MSSTLAEIVEPLTEIVRYFQKYDEDVSDRLNHKYSTLGFLTLSVLVAATQYFGESIKCWTPAQFPESWVEYTNTICWISNTYYIPMSETNILEANRKEIVYYQWVPFVFCAQAFLFYVPYNIWSSLNRSNGMDMHKIVQTCKNIEYLDPEARDKTTKFLVKHMDRSLLHTKQIQTGDCVNLKLRLAELGCFCGKRYGNYLIIVYLAIKLLYVGNVVLQLYMLNHFLGTDYTIYGIEILRDVSRTGSFKESRRFPRVTLCDFEERALGSNIPRTIQCALPINLFNEKVFIFVWFWLVLIGVLNLLSFFSWLWIMFATNRRGFVKKRLKIVEKYKRDEDRGRLTVFCNKYLRQDGHFVLQMIGKNTNEVVVGEMIAALWDHFKRYCSVDRKEEV